MVQIKKGQNKSRVAELDFPSAHTVYEAVSVQICDGCSEQINEGDMFTRRSDKAGTIPGIRYTFCLKCRPVIWSGLR